MKTYKIALVLFITLLINYSFAQSFGERHILSTGVAKNIKAMQLSDIDNDNDMDIIALSNELDEILFIENIGDGNFESIIVLDTVVSPVDIVIADIDNDGDNDLIWCAKENTSKIAWKENLGNGDFSNSITINYYLLEIKEIIATDINQDGFMDLVVSSKHPYKLSCLINSKEKSFSEPIPIQCLGDFEILSFFCTDIDSDGDTDILYTDKGARTAWLENNSTGDFVSDNLIYNSNSTCYYSTVHAFDPDNDGDMDIVLGSSSEDSLHIFQNNGQNKFTKIIFSSHGYYFFNLHSFDIDQDSDLDLIYNGSHGSRGSIKVIENIDGENFAVKELDNKDISGTILKVSDINNDNRPDIVYHFNTSIGWLKNSSNNFFLDHYYITSQTPTPKSISLNDFNNDGENDIFLQSDFPSMFLNLSNEEFSDVIRAEIINHSLEYTASDINNDGFCDIFVNRNVDSLPCIIEENNSGSHFTNIIADELNHFNKQDFYFNDFNNDGKNEIAVTNSNGSTNAIYFHTSNEWFDLNCSDSIILPLGANVDELILADFDGDNKKDIAIGDYLNNIISILHFRNNSMGTNPDTIYHTTNFYDLSKIVPVNIKSKHKKDIYYSGGYFCGCFEINGEGNFTDHYLSMTISDLQSFFFDINNDSLDEFFRPDYFKISIYTNLGNSPQLIDVYPISHLSRGVSIDIDKDGDNDLLYISKLNNECGWLENNFIHASVEENETNNSLLVYPNPAGESINIKLKEAAATDYEILLYNNLGMEINRFQAEANQTQMSINTKELKPGIYYVVLKSENNISTSKVLIVR